LNHYRKKDKKQIDWIGAPLIGRFCLRGIYFVFLPPHKERGTPAHKTTHLQTAASQPCKSKFAKELFTASGSPESFDKRIKIISIKVCKIIRHTLYKYFTLIGFYML
jgi:hypothetical protein